MTNAKNRKLLAVLLALALLSLSVMALGGTLATTFDPNDNDLEYEVTVEYADTIDGTYTNMLTGNIFNGTLWCPGYTKVIYIKVTSEETFPHNCSLDLVVGESTFDSTLEYAVLAPDKNGNLPQASNWEEFKAAAKTATGTLTQSKTYNIFDKVELTATPPTETSAIIPDSFIYALGIHMDEDADNTYKNATMSVKFNFRVNSDLDPAGNSPTPAPNPQG